MSATRLPYGLLLMAATVLAYHPSLAAAHLSVRNVQTAKPASGNGSYLRRPGDYNNDGYVNGSDFLIWQRQIGSSRKGDTGADANGDGVINREDLTVWQKGQGANVRLPGDFNGDGQIDGSDFLLWQRQIGSNVTRDTGADADGNGFVNGDDLSIWQNNSGT